MRISDAALLTLCLGGCSAHAGPAAAPGGELIDCATGGAAAFSHSCAVEHSAQGGDPLLIVNDPSGGFRRFLVVDGGKSLEAADGADALAVADNGDQVDASVAGDRYRFPAKMLRDAAGH